MYNFSNYEPTYNKAIDQCANLIAVARENLNPLKALHLSPIYYDWFKGGVQTLMGRPLQEDERLEFDGVNIEKGSKYQSKSIILEYYPSKHE
jgi:hypothetical protein